MHASCPTSPLVFLNSRSMRREGLMASWGPAKVDYVESFTPSERALLAPFFSDLDGPVFALVNLPETVKAAMFARYSRYPGTLRRLFLDEFAGTLPERAALAGDVEGERAARLFETVFVGYGDDSVAQL